MSVPRLLVTGTVMVCVAGLLRVLAPHPLSAVEVLRGAQQVTTVAGPEIVVLATVGLGAWLAWAWGALGLVLTAASALPGAGGAAARCAGRVVLPAGIRSGAAVALGIGLVVAPSALAQAGPPAGAASAGPAPDWPAGTDPEQPTVADWPEAPPASEPHLVVPGDCLWTIAGDHLRRPGGPAPTDGAVATAVAAWWQYNRTVVGPDPDLIHPGQELQPPAAPPAPTTPGEPR